MAIFNSLGSNYSRTFVLKSLFAFGSPKDTQTVREHLKSLFGGKVTLTYKGRQALELALRRSGLPAGSRVGINGFTCYVVYQAVKNAGLEPVMIDVAKDLLHFDADGLEQTRNLKAVIIQNTFGLVVDIVAIEKVVKQNKLLLIEDLAHSFGAVYDDGREAGTVGDLVMLSFSQDKQQDVVAGGALIDRRQKAVRDNALPQASLWVRAKNRTYPFWSGLIRTGYSLGLGRYIHFVLKNLHLLATPMGDNKQGLASMSFGAARLLKNRLQNQASETLHRRHIAAVYQKELSKNLQYAFVGEPSFVRFPVRVKNPARVITALKRREIYIGDTWYDAPIAPKKYMAHVQYESGQCPNVEKLVTEIVNLPTHKHVSPQQAKKICDIVNQTQKDEQK